MKTRNKDKRKGGYWAERERMREGEWIIREGKGVREREKQKQSMRGRERKIAPVATSSCGYRVRGEYRVIIQFVRFSTILHSFN
ncbi:hypothetical protein ALC56_00916 [Trachymyrmex septentrionalis]|uniref:Uncharacterized protein n=1 Tax=Trachymyrmex septentrionalis TaxID=34720 RepID=A0A151K0Z6_9HYME|nr:hypothetical protein ALC56_00916 [Trachymyrmex septentrionalis]